MNKVGPVMFINFIVVINKTCINTEFLSCIKIELRKVLAVFDTLKSERVMLTTVVIFFVVPKLITTTDTFDYFKTGGKVRLGRCGRKNRVRTTAYD